MNQTNIAEKEMAKEVLLFKLDQILKNIGVDFKYLTNDFLIADEVEIAQLEFDHELNMKIGEKNRKLINNVLNAKRKILEGTYGVCEDCDSPIQSERLNARPMAKRCIHCQEEKERSENANFLKFNKSLSKTYLTNLDYTKRVKILIAEGDDGLKAS